MKFIPLDEKERDALTKALKSNAEDGAPIYMDPKTTRFTEMNPHDEEVIAAIRSVPCHYAEDIVRVLRVIEYEGPRSWVEMCIRTRQIKGEHQLNHVDYSPLHIIRESIIGEIPTIIQRASDEPEKQSS